MKKKIMIVISIIVIILIGVIIVLFLNFKENPKRVIKQFVTAYNKQDVDAIMECLDFVGADSWIFDEEDFSEEDYNDFLEWYKEGSEGDINALNAYKKEVKENLEDGFNDMNESYKRVKVEIDDFKKVEEISDNLYTIKVVISGTTISNNENEEEIEAIVETFIVYKNKIISTEEMEIF